MFGCNDPSLQQDVIVNIHDSQMGKLVINFSWETIQFLEIFFPRVRTWLCLSVKWPSIPTMAFYRWKAAKRKMESSKIMKWRSEKCVRGRSQYWKTVQKTELTVFWLVLQKLSMCPYSQWSQCLTVPRLHRALPFHHCLVLAQLSGFQFPVAAAPFPPLRATDFCKR